jgi:hypothetical protein
MKKVILGVACALFVVGGLSIADPVRNVSGKRHPNLAAAQRLCSQAFEKVEAAQQANEFDMKGHAAHAKDLLNQVNAELKEAAEAANQAK